MPSLDTIKQGDILPEREYEPDNVQLFLYNAVLWNAHRIHFDYPYATQVEGYPGLVMAGPLMGDWLTQSVINWMGEEGRLVSIEYSNRKAAFIGDKLRSGGKILSVDKNTGNVELNLYIRNAKDELIIPGNAIVNLSMI